MEHIWKIVLLIVLFLVIPRWLWGQNTKTKIALLKYKGRGDGYVNPIFLPNLIRFCNENLETDLAKEPVIVKPDSKDIFNYPYVLMTGYENVVLTEAESRNLREYLLAGGFLHADGPCEWTEVFRQEMKKVFPEEELKVIPREHPIFHQKFAKDLSKLVEYENNCPQVLGIVNEGRLVILFTSETDGGNVSENKRERALQMKADIISYVFRSE